MALRMASPYLHPRTHVYWFRKAVPEAIRHKVGKSILSISLKTKDPEQAKVRFLQVALDVQKKWAALKRDVDIEETIQPRLLTHMQRQGLAGEFHRWLIAKHEDNPGAAAEWRERIERDRRIIRPNSVPGVRRPGGAVSLYLEQVRAFLDDRGIIVDDNDLYDLSIAAAHAGVQAQETLARNADGDYSPDPNEARFPSWEKIEPTLNRKSRSLIVERDWDDYVKGRGIAVSSRKRYRQALENLATFIGSKNLALATADHVTRWKVHLAQQGKSPTTIKEIYLTAARSFFKWGIEKDKVTSNPFLGATIPVPKKVQTRLKEYTEDEARTVLSETLRSRRGRETTELASAKKWIPWLCAYTGARVNEITQMRCMDLRLEKVGLEDVWVVHITPEAGSTKNGMPRDVPLHPHLVRRGFPEFVRGRGEGTTPVFYDPGRRRGGKEENPQSHKVGQRLAEWVRDLGMTLKETAANETGEDKYRMLRIAEGLLHPVVKPNHAWRHRFKTVARDCRMRTDVRDAIQGHAAPTEGEKYGHFSVKAMWREIKLIPAFEVGEPTWPAPKSRRAKREYANRKARGGATASPRAADEVTA